MSAARTIHRNSWKSAHPVRTFTEIDFTGGIPHRRGRDKTYHDYEIGQARRHPTFQRNVRVARVNHGLRPGSTNQHHLHDRGY